MADSCGPLSVGSFGLYTGRGPANARIRVRFALTQQCLFGSKRGRGIRTALAADCADGVLFGSGWWRNALRAGIMSASGSGFEPVLEPE